VFNSGTALSVYSGKSANTTTGSDEHAVAAVHNRFGP
jgi:hypothetical protein